MEGIKGQIISGEFSKITIRKKNDQDIELGELLVSESDDGKVLLQAYDMQYGSQISGANIEMASGFHLEEGRDEVMLDPLIRNYTLVMLKPLITFDSRKARLCKRLPRFFGKVRAITKEDLSFLQKPEKELYLGKLRSGSNVIDLDIALDGERIFSHHILIPATTGRGKSNLTSVMLWEQLDKEYCGVLVLDPHDEYYGRSGVGLKDHPRSDMLSYYSPSRVPPGCKTLKININCIKPVHFNGVVSFSDPQRQAMYAYFSQYGREWIKAVVTDKTLVNMSFHEETKNVLKRRLISLLNLSIDGHGKVRSRGIFDSDAGLTTIKDICDELESANTVVINTSNFSGSIEILIGTLITTEIFERYKRYKMKGELDRKPVVSVILEEAPRVLGKDVLERSGSNIFSTIAREGRKFRVGLCAITQLPSLIQRDILANMNTKIILGLELASERTAVIESASQDLSTDSRNIASLDIGEAIVTSNFARFAMPIRIPFFKDLVVQTQNSAMKITQDTREFDRVEKEKSSSVKKML